MAAVKPTITLTGWGAKATLSPEIKGLAPPPPTKGRYRTRSAATGDIETKGAAHVKIKLADRHLSAFKGSTDEDRQNVATLLGINLSDDWVIHDAIIGAGLYLVHYRDGANAIELGRCRGTIVDLPNRQIYVNSYGYTPTATLQSISADNVDTNGALHFKDDNGTPQSFPAGEYYITQGVEGTVIRVFKHNGVVYRATFKKIDATGQRWMASEAFLEAWARLRGPTDAELFPADKKYSPWCYTYMVHSPDLFAGAQDPTTTGSLSFLGGQKFWDPLSAPYPRDEIDLGPVSPAVTRFDDSLIMPIPLIPASTLPTPPPLPRVAALPTPPPLPGVAALPSLTPGTGLMSAPTPIPAATPLSEAAFPSLPSKVSAQRAAPIKQLAPLAHIKRSAPPVVIEEKKAEAPSKSTTVLGDTAAKLATLVTSVLLPPPPPIPARAVRTPQLLTIPAANVVLKDGIFNGALTVDDARVGLGEFVIVFRVEPGAGPPESRPIRATIKIASPGYMWRTNMRMNSHNILESFCLLSTMTNKAAQRTFIRLIPHYGYDEKTMDLVALQMAEGKANFAPALPAGDTTWIPDKPSDRLIYIWFAFVMSLPLRFRRPALHLLKTFEEFRHQIIKHLIATVNGVSKGSIDHESLPKQIGEAVGRIIANKSGTVMKDVTTLVYRSQGREIWAIARAIITKYAQGVKA